MRKTLLILVLLFKFLFESFSQVDTNYTHIYGIPTDYLYLNILCDNQYNMKVSNYGDYIKGEYKVDKDTLELISFKYIEGNYGLTDYLEEIMKKSPTKFLIDGHFLIPQLSEESEKTSYRMLHDTTIIDEYGLYAGPQFCDILFYNDSTYYFRTGIDAIMESAGTWIEQNNVIVLHPDDSGIALQNLCLDKKFKIVGNYLISTKYNDRVNTIELSYLRRLKPADNKKHSAFGNKSNK